MGDVAGQDGERALRCAIGGDERLPAVGRHRLDVDDRAGDLLPPHDPRGLLDEKERRAHVDVENLVVALLGGVEDVATVGQRGGVDERVDAAEALVRLGDNLAAIGDAGEIGFDEHGRTAGRGNLACDPFALLRVAAADDYSGGAAFGEQSRDGLAEPLRAAGDDGDLAVEICRPSIGWARGRGGLGGGGLGHERFLLGAKRRAGGLSLLAATYTPSRSPASRMKQKFYSQVNMERIFFFE